MSEPTPHTVDLRSEDQAVLKLGPGMFRKDLVIIIALSLLVAFILGMLVLYIRMLPQIKLGPNDVQIIRGWLFAVQAVIAVVSLGLVSASYVRFLELTPQFVRQYKLFRTTEIPLDEIERCVLAPQNNRLEWTLSVHSKNGAHLTGPLPIWRAKDRQKVIAFLLELESRGLRLENLVKFHKSFLERNWQPVPEWNQRIIAALGTEIYRCPYEAGYLEKFKEIDLRWVDLLPLVPLPVGYLGMKFLDWHRGAISLSCAACLILIILSNRNRKPLPSREFAVGENGVGFYKGDQLMEAYSFADLQSLKFGFVRYGFSPTVTLQMRLQTGQEMEFDLETKEEMDREVLKSATARVKALQAEGSA